MFRVTRDSPLVYTGHGGFTTVVKRKRGIHHLCIDETRDSPLVCVEERGIHHWCIEETRDSPLVYRRNEGFSVVKRKRGIHNWCIYIRNEGFTTGV